MNLPTEAQEVVDCEVLDERDEYSSWLREVSSERDILLDVSELEDREVHEVQVSEWRLRELGEVCVCEEVRKNCLLSSTGL